MNPNIEEPTPGIYQNFFGTVDIPRRGHNGPVFVETEQGRSLLEKGPFVHYIVRHNYRILIRDYHDVAHLVYCSKDGRAKSTYTYVAIPSQDSSLSEAFILPGRLANNRYVLLLGITDYAYRPFLYIDPITQKDLQTELITATVWKPDKWERRARESSIVTYTVIGATEVTEGQFLQLGPLRYEVLEKSIFVRLFSRRPIPARESMIGNRLWIETERILTSGGSVLRYVNESVVIKGERIVFGGKLEGGPLFPEWSDSGDLMLRGINGSEIGDQAAGHPKTLGKAKLITA